MKSTVTAMPSLRLVMLGLLLSALGGLGLVALASAQERPAPQAAHGAVPAGSAPAQNPEGFR